MAKGTLNQEFSDQFDVYYNNISSNQAPGLDEYEKSLFLTRGQDDVVKAYFNPFLNKVQAGYDGNERRQIDFSMITRSKVYNDSITIEFLSHKIDKGDWSILPLEVNSSVKEKITVAPKDEDSDPKHFYISPLENGMDKDTVSDYFVDGIYNNHSYVWNTDGTMTVYNTLNTDKYKKFDNPIFDLRDNTRSVVIDENILMLINEYVEVLRDNKRTRLTVDPITYTEYSRIMSKPYKRPVKNKAWKLIDSTDGTMRAELIIGPTDTLQKYVMRYIKRPRPIILNDFGTEEDHDVTIEGQWKAQECELDPILYPDIIQRAVEFAWAAYKEPSLNNQITLGQASGTNVGALQSQGRRDE